MALTTTGTLTATVSWASSDTDNPGVNVTSAGSISYSQELTAGSGNEQVNTEFHDVRTIGAGQFEEFDLSSLSHTYLGRTVSTSFLSGNVKSIIIKNNSETIGEQLSVMATGSNAADFLFNGSGSAPIMPKGCYFAPNPLDGWAIQSSNVNFQVHNPNSVDVAIDISVLGVTATG